MYTDVCSRQYQDKEPNTKILINPRQNHKPMRKKTVTIIAVILVILAAAILAACLPPQDPSIQKCRSLQRANLRDICFSELGILRQDPSLCEKAKDKLSVDYCYEKIAEAKNSSDGCTKTTSQYWGDICYTYFGKQNNNETLCLKIKDDPTRDGCFLDIGKDTLNNQWCQQIRDYGERTSCFAFVGKTLRDASVCLILGQPERDICKYNVAVGTMNTTICSEITFNRIKISCKERITEKINETITNTTGANIEILNVTLFNATEFEEKTTV